MCFALILPSDSFLSLCLSLLSESLTRTSTHTLFPFHSRLLFPSLLLSLLSIPTIGQRHFDYVGQDSDSDSDSDSDGEAETGTGIEVGVEAGAINRTTTSHCETGGPIGTMDRDHGIHSTSCSTPPLPLVTVYALSSSSSFSSSSSSSAPAAPAPAASTHASSPTAIVAMTESSSSTHHNSGNKSGSSCSSSSSSVVKTKSKDSPSQCTVSGLQIWSIPYTPILLPDPHEAQLVAAQLVEAPLVEAEAGRIGVIDGGGGDGEGGGAKGGGGGRVGVEGDVGVGVKGGDGRTVEALNAMDVTEDIDVIFEGHKVSTLA